MNKSIDKEVIAWWIAIFIGIALIVIGVANYASVAVALIVAGCLIVFIAIRIYDDKYSNEVRHICNAP